jgi:outer membrane protein OmpA-like peptidoglycan-associated protein
MKLTRFTTLLVLGLVLTLAASACRKRPGEITHIPGRTPTQVKDVPDTSPVNPNATATGTNTSGIPQPDPKQFENYTPNAEIFKANTAYFDFDSSVLKDSEKSKVGAVADYLKANKADALRIEGHCDERGTEEYNRSLGERRALALREDLVAQGVDAAHIITLTFGKDRPAAPGHDEAAWKMNRRGEFILLTPPKQP